MVTCFTSTAGPAKYLEPAAGKANWNVFAMAREGLGQTISSAFREAVQQNKIVAAQALVIDAERRREVRVTIDPIASPKQMEGMVMIVFTEVESQTTRKTRKRPVETSDDDLRHQLDLSLDALRAARNDAQSAEDQSRAANEELQSANEELQSTNEELTTSKEEMQSMNEELQTVNQELQAKLNELTQASDDMRNLLNSTDIATLFLDEELRIRRFTVQVGSLFKLIPIDIGRPITDISNELTNWAVADDARAVLGNLVYQEREVSASGDRWFKVRTMPYRTSQNRIDGVVITFSDITKAKQLEIQLREARDTLQDRLGTSAVTPTRAPTASSPTVILALIQPRRDGPNRAGCRAPTWRIEWLARERQRRLPLPWPSLKRATGHPRSSSLQLTATGASDIKEAAPKVPVASGRNWPAA